MSISETKTGIELACERDVTSINQFVAMAAAEKLAALDAEDYFRSRVARADLAAFDRIMSRAGGEPPREGDERQGFLLFF
jgi:hypothetical protein